ncbi:uncharacterized protein MONOS_5092 [Monocercomonoides exilis]|uniref:uncharacterized protein n=1 Tax=Monocercomonoides exilis TaxID=2049356 RepID=UPI003559A1D0|nr:hypothetical protein MONOS_5092 [Monocercomonoides exilis]|eukprot:MONOS_5092.1-p1 / transcript=MONOS_5092.1 / gene=MONOS_5092 / organism=Monocercomonoides_exilis_PA203 / gene_product=unspecified product / transcript_product=unspecified product / location=Mono_scaffold00144:75372-77525(-) / protein_length=626 / sequence_SO=supercontig / SO=protein_coding / is_pseudo=false
MNPEAYKALKIIGGSTKRKKQEIALTIEEKFARRRAEMIINGMLPSEADASLVMELEKEYKQKELERKAKKAREDDEYGSFQDLSDDSKFSKTAALMLSGNFMGDSKQDADDKRLNKHFDEDSSFIDTDADGSMLEKAHILLKQTSNGELSTHIDEEDSFYDRTKLHKSKLERKSFEELNETFETIAIQLPLLREALAKMKRKQERFLLNSNDLNEEEENEPGSVEEEKDSEGRDSLDQFMDSISKQMKEERKNNLLKRIEVITKEIERLEKVRENLSTNQRRASTSSEKTISKPKSTLKERIILPSKTSLSSHYYSSVSASSISSSINLLNAQKGAAREGEEAKRISDSVESEDEDGKIVTDFSGDVFLMPQPRTHNETRGKEEPRKDTANEQRESAVSSEAQINQTENADAKGKKESGKENEKHKNESEEKSKGKESAKGNIKTTEKKKKKFSFNMLGMSNAEILRRASEENRRREEEEEEKEIPNESDELFKQKKSKVKEGHLMSYGGDQMFESEMENTQEQENTNERDNKTDSLLPIIEPEFLKLGKHIKKRTDEAQSSEKNKTPFFSPDFYNTLPSHSPSSRILSSSDGKSNSSLSRDSDEGNDDSEIVDVASLFSKKTK